MSDILVNDVADWLADLAGVEVGVGFFVGRMPAELSLATQIRQTGGAAAGFDIPFYASFQILTRGDSPAATLARAWAIFDAIKPVSGGRRALRNVNISADWRLLAVDPLQPPFDLGVSEAGKHQQVWNLQVRCGRRG